MARLSNLYGAAPVAQAQRRGGGGGGSKRPRNPNRGGGGGGGGTGVGGSGGINAGLYTGDEGAALANQDPMAFIRAILGASGQLDATGTPYGDYINTQRQQDLLDQYTTAQANSQDQGLNPVDWLQNTYGAGWTTAQGEKRKHGPGRRPGETTFNAGNLPSSTVDTYNQWYSNTEPLSYLNTNAAQGGGRIEHGGNTDFQNWYDQSFIPGVQSQLEAARANGYTPAGGTGSGGAPSGLGGPGGGPGSSPGGALPHIPGGGGGFVGPNPTLSLADFIQGRDLVNEARQSYAFRPNAQRLPVPLSLSGRYSWWS